MFADAEVGWYKLVASSEVGPGLFGFPIMDIAPDQP